MRPDPFIALQELVVGGVQCEPHAPADQNQHACEPQNMPERGHHAHKGTHLTNRFSDEKIAWIGSIVVQGLHLREHHQDCQQRVGERESHDTDLGGQVERRRCDERLHDDHTNPNETDIDQVILLEPPHQYDFGEKEEQEEKASRSSQLTRSAALLVVGGGMREGSGQCWRAASPP